MNKKIVDGKVGVVIHNDYGAGWYTSHYEERLVFDPTLIDMIQEGRSKDEIEKYCIDNYDPNEYYGSCCYALEVVWIPEGSEFEIREYDGYESVVLRNSIKWMKA